MCLGLANGVKQPAKMTVQEAIQILELNRICSPQATQFNNAVVLAKAALEKQIPKKPIVDPANLCDFQNFHCPECNQKIIARLDGEWIAGKLQNYCDKCGQALDWSGDNGKE